MKTAPVRFNGIQEGFGPIPPVPYYDTLEAFGPFGADTTLTRLMIERAGYSIPASELESEQKGWKEFAANGNHTVMKPLR